MTAPLWTWDELVGAAGGSADGTASEPVTGFSIDSRAAGPGDVFVALKDVRDGHDFVGSAFQRGAAAALVADSYVRKPGDGALIRVADTLKGLEAIGRAARARLSAEARVVAVTGSAGKTTTKEMLRACLGRLGQTHAADKSFNNHIGVPLTLARMPATSRYAVFEIGMNHAGEITPLTRMVRPHAAIVTTVEAVHLEHFSGIEAIADAKAEVFAGLEPGGPAILNRDNPQFGRLAAAARALGRPIISFGNAADADVRFETLALMHDHSEITTRAGGRNVSFRVGFPGVHIAQNALAVAAALAAIGADLEPALAALAELSAPAGRGARVVLKRGDGQALLIDESYNANPASMRAALAAMASVPRADFARRIAVLGDMLELGPEADRLHADLLPALDAAGVDLVFACGPHMNGLYNLVASPRRGAWAPTSAGIEAALLAAVTAGDVIMVKGSNGSRLGPLVEALKLATAA